MELDEFAKALSPIIAETIIEFAGNQLVPSSFAAFDVGCFPWHRHIELSALTRAEVVSDPRLLDPSETAAWHNHDFSGSTNAWKKATPILREMSIAYSAATDADLAAVAKSFISACVLAVDSAPVKAALALLAPDKLQITVAHPDTNEPFWPIQIKSR